ncbi:MAG TPA: nucleoside triphosphate pyrophosphatase [Steroidobacteraceae bacterium]|nr:nucleoside triphosphate pyrophosphatase [Steroidobacteraceae bacterium]
MNDTDFIYLASGSPRRRELLQQIGVAFQVVGIELDETALADETPLAYVSRLAVAKAAAGWLQSRGSRDAPVLAADTAVVLDGRILGKPADMENAISMLLELSGRTHEVLTAVALRTGAGTQLKVSRSMVTFGSIDAAEARDYWATGEPRDKAGAYAIQGYAAVFIADLEGSYSGVMGLPLFETAELLEAAGIGRWRRDEH